jgi:hypothetical protein
MVLRQVSSGPELDRISGGLAANAALGSYCQVHGSQLRPQNEDGADAAPYPGRRADTVSEQNIAITPRALALMRAMTLWPDIHLLRASK